MFDQSVEALFCRALRSRMSDACVRELREAGLDIEKPLRPHYSEEEYSRHVEIARRHLFPHLEDQEAYHRMGCLFIDGYLQTAIGKALKVLLRLLGPERNLRRMPSYFEGGTNYIKAKGEQIGPGHWVLTVSAVSGHPTFTQGSLEETMRISGAPDVVVSYEVQPDQSVRYRIRWGRSPPARVG